MEIILASTSPYRKELLDRLNIEFKQLSPTINEDDYKNDNIGPKELAQKLAQLKALSLKDANPDSLIIGSDQVAVFEGQTLSKPGNKENALIQLKMINGKTHHLHTAVSIVTPFEIVNYTNTTELKMREFTEEQLKTYIDQDDPIYCAGSFKIECKGISLFSEIKTTDFSAITGLPLIKTSEVLHQYGLLF